HARDAVIDRDLEDRMLFLDLQSGCFRRFIGRVRGFRLPIHLQAKSAVLRLLALRNRLRDGYRLRHGWNGYGLRPLSCGHHLMISFMASLSLITVATSRCGLSRASGQSNGQRDSARAANSLCSPPLLGSDAPRARCGYASRAKKERVRAKLRTCAPPRGAATVPAAWAWGSSLRAAPVSSPPCAHGEPLRLSRGSCARMVFHTPCGALTHEKCPRAASFS